MTNRKLFLCCLCCLFLILNIGSLFLPLKEPLTYDEVSKFESGLAILSGKPSERGATDVNKRNIVPASALNVLISKPIPELLDLLQKSFYGKVKDLLSD